MYEIFLRFLICTVQFQKASIIINKGNGFRMPFLKWLLKETLTHKIGMFLMFLNQE